MKCMNYCDILSPHTIQNVVENPTHRIYIGSYFCSQYFLQLSNKLLQDFFEYCQSSHVAVTLVVPILTEKNYQKGIEKISYLLKMYSHIIDEITVNDYGLMEYIHTTYHIPINMGRLFMKDYRDPRYLEYYETTWRPKVFTGYLDQIISRYDIKGLEFDVTHQEVDFSQKPKDILVAVHVPYTYMTVGQICEYASISKEIKKKFRPNLPCQLECLKHRTTYCLNDDRTWVRIGRAIYFDNSKATITGVEDVRLIDWPVHLEVEV